MRSRSLKWVGQAISGMILAMLAGPEAVGLDDDRAGFGAVVEQFDQQARPVLASSCLECHSSEVAEGGVDLEAFDGIDDLKRASKTWQDVARVLDLGEMPPEGADPLPPSDRDQLRGWIDRFLEREALDSAGDPGPVLLRRLTNAQYSHTVRDLTGLEDLDPAREFPTDGASGEGFTNSGGSLVMSPSLLEKYVEAAKGIADHLVLLPEGVRFSPGITRRDWTDEAVARIRAFHSRFAGGGEGTTVNLQGIVFDTNQGGRLPLEQYLSALLEDREEIRRGSRSLDNVAEDRGLSPKYLRMLWQSLEEDRSPSMLLDPLRASWRSARIEDTGLLLALIAPWQESLWRFNSVGHIGKVGGPTSWMEPVSLVDRQEMRVTFPPDPVDSQDEMTLFLAVPDLGDDPEHPALALWERPRIVTPGRPDLPLRDLRAVAHRLESRRSEVLNRAVECLDAASEAIQSPNPADPDAIAERLGIPSDVMDAWFSYLGVGQGPPTIPADALLADPIEGAGGYGFVNGWGHAGMPNVVANSSDEHVRIPGNLRPHSVALHPSPGLRVAAGWRSPVAGSIRVEARVQHAHPECGNGVAWQLELRQPGTRRRLASGTAGGIEPVPVGPIEGSSVLPGDLVVLSIGPRDGNHSCDLTSVDLTVSGLEQSWDLAADVSPDIKAGNPHPDRLGNPGVWVFFSEPDGDASSDSVIPEGSLLSRWQDAEDPLERSRLARQIGALISGDRPADPDSPDAALLRQLSSIRGPLLGRLGTPEPLEAGAAGRFGLDPKRFGVDPEGNPIDPESLAVPAGSTIELRLPAELVAGSEFVATGRLIGEQGIVQFRSSTAPIEAGQGPVPGLPIISPEGSRDRDRIASDLAAFQSLFPPALCYSKIVPVDEVITLMLHYREDDHLRRLMLDDQQAEELDRLWHELEFISHDALKMVDAFQQLLEYASQDGDPSVFEPLRGPIEHKAEAFRDLLVSSEPEQLDAVVSLASIASRRPLEENETRALRELYRSLRSEEIPHDEAIRLTQARILVAPAFLYRVERPGPGASPSSLSSWELASRLSYFLWASMPDKALRDRAASGELLDPDALVEEFRRMRDDDHIRRFAEEFACQWLQVYDFPSLDEKSERHFPSFADLRPAMYEETIRFFADLVRDDRPVSDILDADDTFLNEDLARHYGIDGVTGPAWRRVEEVKQHGRGGILALATTLSKQSGASRTSPILRGNWVSEVLLGERLPRPPKDVPVLPEDEALTDGLTVRELVERHTQDPKCAGCHRRIDPFGFALERYDAIGRVRTIDLGARPIDTRTTLPDGEAIDGIEGLRRYLLEDRRDAFVRQFCRKLLGYALGRAVQLSDEPLIDEMQRQLDDHEGRVSAAIETILRSPQFRQIRGRDFDPADPS